MGMPPLWESICFCWHPEDDAVTIKSVLPHGSIIGECLLAASSAVERRTREQRREGERSLPF